MLILIISVTVRNVFLRLLYVLRGVLYCAGSRRLVVLFSLCLYVVDFGLIITARDCLELSCSASCTVPYTR